MIYQLSNGKVVEISIDQYFDLTDDDIEYLIAYNIGEEINNPFFNSSFNYKQVIIKEEYEDDEFLDLLDIDIEEKLTDLDITIFED